MFSLLTLFAHRRHDAYRRRHLRALLLFAAFIDVTTYEDIGRLILLDIFADIFDYFPLMLLFADASLRFDLFSPCR